ncbi:MAG: response regulator [Ignavibacteriaceae bacterium]
MNRILVIEDDSSVRKNLIELLNEEGIETYEAENGKIGIQKAKQTYPDLIISDILMPEADGYAVLKELQKEPGTSSIPFVFLSARTDMNDIRSGMNIGADDYLTKPYKAEDLLAAVNLRLQKKRVSDQRINNILRTISLTLPHELRTPLVSILGYSQILQEDINALKKEDIHEMVSHINSSGYELLNMIEKFLLFSQLETSNAAKINNENAAESCKVKEIITKLALAEAEKAGRVNDLIIDLEEGIINANKKHLEFLIKELLENAFKFSSDRTSVSVSSLNLDEFYAIKIADKGMGIRNEHINEIGILRQFDRDRNCQKGSGVGLAIAFKIADMYKMKINIESQTQNSTIIEIYIPYK